MIFKKVFLLFCLLNIEIVRAIPPVDSWRVPGRFGDEAQQAQQDQAQKAQQDQAAQQDGAAQQDQAAQQDETQVQQKQEAQKAAQAASQAASQKAMTDMQAKFTAASQMFKNMDASRQTFSDLFAKKLSAAAQAPQADRSGMRSYNPNPPPFFPGRRLQKYRPGPPPYAPPDVWDRDYLNTRRMDQAQQSQQQQDKPYNGQYHQSALQSQSNPQILQQQRQQMLRNQMQAGQYQAHVGPQYQAGYIQGYPAQGQSGQFQGHLGQMQGAQVQGHASYGRGDSLEQEIQMIRQLLGGHGTTLPIGSIQSQLAANDPLLRFQQQIGK